MIAASYQSKKTFTTVGTILLTHHLPDLYAALLQLAYGPTMTLSTVQRQPSSPNATPMDPSQIFRQQQQQTATTLTRAERDKCARMLMWLFDRSDVRRCMESLMLLLGTSPLHPVPQWLRTICGRFLSRILLKPQGVATVLEFTVADVEQVQLDQLEKVSKLVLAIPKQIRSVEEYYDIIVPQLLALLKENATSPHAQASTRQAVTFIIGKMIVDHTELGISKIVDPIMHPLVSHWMKSTGDIGDGNEDKDVLSESELETLLRILHQVMVGGEPSAVVIQSFLKSATSVLYYLYDYTVKSKSGLREIILDILKTYFRIIDSSEAVTDLKRIVLSKRDLNGDRLAYFAPGPSGGVVMRSRRHPKPLAGNALPLDPGVLVDFVAEATMKQDLCGDFFVFLLNEMLLILHLVTGMQEKLGPEILSKPAQIIGFASNVITDYIESIERMKQIKGVEKAKSANVDIRSIVSEDDLLGKPTMADVQEDFASLVMAINLLRAIIHENEELDTRTSQLLGSTVGPLKQLESYRIAELEEPIHELLLMITSSLSMQKMGRGRKSGPENESKEKYRDAMKALQDNLMPVRAHGMAILRDMVLARDPLVSTEDGLSNVLDIFVRLVQDEDSYIYLNAIKGLSALTDVHGNAIIQKLGAIYSDDSQKLDNRLRVGEALLQTVQRSGDALSIYGKVLQAHTLVFSMDSLCKCPK
ncbi:hypothetical protein BX666DRAFT_1870111 [Dichotomocladium elegans]|nr:hypothetical protein BX666DRAFT_1870111 [Dichotomocladium elegans]